MQSIITVPINKEADEAFDYNNASEHQLIRLYLTNNEVELLFNYGVVNLINHISNIIIDHYEEEWIRNPQDIKKAIEALKQEDYSYNKELDILVKKIINLMEEAVKREVGIYFFF